jgi:hypothetical protein
MKIKLYFILLFSLIYSLLPIIGQIDTGDTGPSTTDDVENSFALFEDDKLLETTLRLDMAAFVKKNLIEISNDAVITFHLSETDSIQKKVSIKNRGNFRLETCSFPPMQINFKKQIFAYRDSGKIKKIKMVVHCRSGKLYDEYVLREYLVYKMFNILTDTSYRVRLLRVNYIDDQNKKKSQTQYAFFIEPKKLLAKRTNTIVLETPNVTQKNIVPDVLDRVAIFNYMVSNWDWSVPGQHNLTVLKTKNIYSGGLAVAVPYDFDLTGVVNSNYAVTHPEHNINNVRERIYLGICRDQDVFREELNEFLSFKEGFYNIVNEFPYLDQRSKKDITGFLDQFFDRIENPRTLETLLRILTTECKDF